MSKKQNWVVYIVRCADDSLYTGITTDLGRRVTAHNDGTGSRYTRARLPVGLVYSEQAASHSAALQREAAIKRMTTAAKRALVSARDPS